MSRSRCHDSVSQIKAFKTAVVCRECDFGNGLRLALQQRFLYAFPENLEC
jgi:hypothetical protein